MGCNATTEMYMYIFFLKKKNQRKEKWPKQLVYLIIKTWCRVTCTSFVPLHYSIIIKSTSQKKHPNVYKQTKQCLQLQSYTWYSERNIKGTSHGTHVKRLDPYTQTIRLIRSDFHNEGFLTVISIMSLLHTVSDILPWCSVSSSLWVTTVETKLTKLTLTACYQPPIKCDYLYEFYLTFTLNHCIVFLLSFTWELNEEENSQ